MKFYKEYRNVSYSILLFGHCLQISAIKRDLYFECKYFIIKIL